MTDYNILGITDSKKWNDYLLKLPRQQQDIYFTPEYYSLYEQCGEGQAQCFVYDNDGKVAIYPFLKNSINKLGYVLSKDYYDIQGAYGFNGIIANCSSSQFLSDLSATFQRYCTDNNIVAEFIRFNAIIENQLFSSYLIPFYTLDIIIINLEPPIENIWNNSLESRARTAINKAIRSGLEFNVITGNEISSNDIEQFTTIYYSTMKRNNADDFYFFSEEYFSQLIKKMPDNLLLSFVKKDGIAISTEIDLFKNENAYAFLGGTLSEYNIYNPNSFLRFEFVKVLKNIGVKKYLIGGGHTRNDGIYKYKKS